METIWEMWWKHFFFLSASEKVLQSLVIMAGDAVSKVKTWKHTHSFWKKIWTTLTHSTVICFSSDFFLVNTYKRNKIIYAEIWGSASVSSLCFLKNCLSAVWRIGSAEFLPEINEEGKGNISHLVELSQPQRPLKPTCSLKVSCLSTDSSQTCLAD